MTELQANFTLEPQQPINASFELGDPAPIEATFSLDVQGITEHNLLSNRDYPDQHPIDAITGLREALDESDAKIQTEKEERIAADADLQEQIDNIDVTDDTFVYEQGIASDVWVITHNLNKYPSITLVDSAGTVFKAKEEYNSANQVTVYLNGATTGKAYLN
jgi:hypothetical protein